MADGSLPTSIRSIVRTVGERVELTRAREAMASARRALDTAFDDFAAECRDRAQTTPDEIGRDFAMLVELGEQAYARTLLVRRRVFPSQAYEARSTPVHTSSPWAEMERDAPELLAALSAVEAELDDICTGEALTIADRACRLAHATAKYEALKPVPPPMAPTDLGLRVAA